VPNDGSFPIEDFIESITAQLDRVQDGLVVKGEIRPLVYALKDLTLDLQVFVELDSSGNVRFRPSGPNETGTSTVHLNFTTMTRPMIAENTIALSTVRTPSLADLGLAEQERRGLERLGIRNAAQLQKVGGATGTRAISHLSSVPMDRLRKILAGLRPTLSRIEPEPPPPPPVQPAPRPPAPAHPAPPVRPVPPVRPNRPDRADGQVGRPSFPGRPRPGTVVTRPPASRFPRADAEIGMLPDQPLFDNRVAPRPPAAGRPGAPGHADSDAEHSLEPQPVVVRPGTRRIGLGGRNLIGETGPPTVRLNHQPLSISEADDGRVVVDLPPDWQEGALQVEMPDGNVLSFALVAAPDEPDLWQSQGTGDPYPGREDV
jgi:hypothetical protein